MLSILARVFVCMRLLGCSALSVETKRLSWLPNALTVSRLAVVPVVSTAIVSQQPVLAQTSLAIGGLTDFFDGYLARRLGVESRFGAFLDPVVDKICVAATSIALTMNYGIIIGIPTTIIISREIAVSALREWAAQQQKSNLVAVGTAGKVKTTSQFIALFLLASGGSNILLYKLGISMFFLATGLTLYSGMLLFKQGAPLLFSSSPQRENLNPR